MKVPPDWREEGEAAGLTAGPGVVVGRRGSRPGPRGRGRGARCLLVAEARPHSSCTHTQSPLVSPPSFCLAGP